MGACSGGSGGAGGAGGSGGGCGTDNGLAGGGVGGVCPAAEVVDEEVGRKEDAATALLTRTANIGASSASPNSLFF